MNDTQLVCCRQRSLLKEEAFTERFHELAETALAEAVLEREGFLVRNVALLGPESRNGYRYTAEAMQEAAPLYDGRPVFIDHAGGSGKEAWKNGRMEGHASSSPLPSFQSSNLPFPQRSIRDYAGKVVNPRFEGERIRGDVQLLGPNADWLFSLIEAAPSDIGMSHVVLARRNHAGDQVEQIEKVVSVDIVAFPATVQSFREAAFRREPEASAVEIPTSSEREPEGANKRGDMKRALIAAIRGS